MGCAHKGGAPKPCRTYQSLIGTLGRVPTPAAWAMCLLQFGFLKHRGAAAFRRFCHWTGGSDSHV